MEFREGRMGWGAVRLGPLLPGWLFEASSLRALRRAWCSKLRKEEGGSPGPSAACTDYLTALDRLDAPRS